MNVTPLESSADAAIADIADKALDLGLEKERHAPPFPIEIVRIIVSYLVADGLQLSNDQEFESDLETIKTLLGTTRWIRDEILRHPLTVYITEGKDCGCEAIASMQSDVSTPLADRIRHIPLHIWPQVVIKIAPGVRHQPCTFNWTPMLGHLADPEAEPPDVMAQEFMLAFYCVLQQSQIVALTIKTIYNPLALKDMPLVAFLLNPKPPLRQEDVYSCKFECCQREQLGERLKINIIFKRPRRIRLADQVRIPLWDANMVFDILGAWRWTAESQHSGIVLPSMFHVPMQHPGTIWKSVRNADAPIRQAFPHNPQKFIDNLPTQLCESWSNPMYHSGGLNPWCAFIGAHNTYGRQWYYSNEPLSTSPTDYTVYGHTILRVRIPEPEEAVTPSSHWEGEFLGTDYPLDRNGQLHGTRVRNRLEARRAAAMGTSPVTRQRRNERPRGGRGGRFGSGFGGGDRPSSSTTGI